MTKTTTPRTETAKIARMVNENIAAQDAAPKVRRTRAAVKTLNKAPADIAANAAAEKARKAASKKALAESRKAEKAAEVKPAPVVQVPTPDQMAEKAARDHAAYLDALRVDAAALGVDPDAYIAEQTAPAPKAGKYTGPMLALRHAAKSYVKAANGQPCNGDELAVVLWGCSREEVVQVLGRHLYESGVTAGTNPYLHLNPGQQSMNLRNKFRGALKSGKVTLAGLRAAVDKIGQP